MERAAALQKIERWSRVPPLILVHFRVKKLHQRGPEEWGGVQLREHALQRRGEGPVELHVRYLLQDREADSQSPADVSYSELRVRFGRTLDLRLSRRLAVRRLHRRRCRRGRSLDGCLRIWLDWLNSCRDAHAGNGLHTRRNNCLDARLDTRLENGLRNGLHHARLNDGLDVMGIARLESWPGGGIRNELRGWLRSRLYRGGLQDCGLRVWLGCRGLGGRLRWVGRSRRLRGHEVARADWLCEHLLDP